MSDAVLSAFSVFFMQSSSFLEHQRLMELGMRKSNAQGLFGVHQTPSDNQTRNLLAPVSLDVLQPLYQEIFKELLQVGN